ncbi:MAG: Zn-binding domain-containing protein, partial [Caulobacteraceae bacterium]
HALIAEIALECGYPASSLSERVYAEPSTQGADDFSRCGILIYTATAGAQGTLGGLVGAAPRFASILRGALERLAICSNDPVCADHTPDGQSGDRATHGAACHGCLLISETSCEKRNLFLDRALLVATMAQNGAALFPPP